VTELHLANRRDADDGAAPGWPPAQAAAPPEAIAQSWHFSQRSRSHVTGQICTFAATRCRSGRTRRDPRDHEPRGWTPEALADVYDTRLGQDACDASTRSGSRGRPQLLAATIHTVAMASARQVALEVAGREVVITNPDKVSFRSPVIRSWTWQVLHAVADGAAPGYRRAAIVLKRYVDGAEGEPFFTEGAPAQHPSGYETGGAAVSVGPDGARDRVRDAAQLLWIVNLRVCIDLNAPGPRRPTRAIPTSCASISTRALA